MNRNPLNIYHPLNLMSFYVYNNIEWWLLDKINGLLTAKLTLSLNKGRIKVLAKQRVRKVTEVLLEQRCDVVRTQLTLHQHLLSRVKILSQLTNIKIYLLEYFFVIIKRGLAAWYRFLLTITSNWKNYWGSKQTYIL